MKATFFFNIADNGGVCAVYFMAHYTVLWAVFFLIFKFKTIWKQLKHFNSKLLTWKTEQ